MEEKLSIKDGIYIFNFLLPNIAFIIIPSPNSIIPSLTLIGKGLVFLLYLIPTFLFIRYIKKNKISFNEFKISNFKFKDLKGVRLNCMLFLLSIIEGVYLSFNGFWYVGIPTILMSIELIPCIILDLRKKNEELLILNTLLQEYPISIEELERYDKWKGSYTGIIWTFIESIIIIEPLFLPQIYFNLMPDTIYPYLIYCILYIYLFIDGIYYPRMLDCKNNSFIKAKGICISHEGVGKGVGWSYVVKIVGADMTVSVNTEKRIFTNRQVVTVIFGLHSKQVIRAY